MPPITSNTALVLRDSVAVAPIPANAPALGGVAILPIDLATGFSALPSLVTNMRPSGILREAPSELPEDWMLTITSEMRQPPVAYTKQCLEVIESLVHML